MNPVSAHYLTVLRSASEKLGILIQPQAITDPDQFKGVYRLRLPQTEIRSEEEDL